MGTPEIAARSFLYLKKTGFDIAAVFTQPDKVKNRGQKIEFSPVKKLAVEYDVPVYQPGSLKRGDDAERSLQILKEIDPDVIVVVAYGQILPKSVLELPKYGCINLHASLLPKYRGAAPIQRCIQNGETVSGVCTMKMDEGLDTGDVIMTFEQPISPDMTGTELTEIFAVRGAELLVQTLVKLDTKTAHFSSQEYCETPSYADKITKEELCVDFTKPAKQVHDFIRAMADVPCAYTFLDGKRLKIYRSAPVGITSELEAGTVADEKSFAVVCGDGRCVELREVQLEGSKRMKSEDFLRGKKLEKGQTLGR
ncbi:MAG: methionyl-tRNA formyltransferase [Oscillospiraceae bacterium]|nr:methionyl-tRNA formyltransferase [Oscillospiraceae bacterium]